MVVVATIIYGLIIELLCLWIIVPTIMNSEPAYIENYFTVTQGDMLFLAVVIFVFTVGKPSIKGLIAKTNIKWSATAILFGILGISTGGFKKWIMLLFLRDAG